MGKLWKTTIVIWSDFDPHDLELDDLARDAVSGESYCSKQKCTLVDDPGSDPDWDGTEFFGTEDDEDDEDDDLDDGPGEDDMSSSRPNQNNIPGWSAGLD